MGNSNNHKNENEKIKRSEEIYQLEQKFIELCKNELIGFTITEAYTYITDDYNYRHIYEIRKVNNVMITHDYDSGRLNVVTNEKDKIIEIINIG